MPVARAYDVVVVGGRVAGSLTAALFARRGLDVLVVDRARFPSPTLSTHFFRGDGLIRVVSRAGLLADLESLGAPRLTCQYDYQGGSESFEVGEPQEPGSYGACLAVRRETLDHTLLEGARRLGADMLTATSVAGVLTSGGSAYGIRLGDGRELRAELVVGADGRRSRVARDVAAADREREAGKRALYYRYVSGLPSPRGGPPDGPEFSVLGDEIAYVFPCDGELACVAISVNLAEYERMRHDVRTRFDALLRRHRGLWPRYARSTPVGRLFAGSPQPDFVRAAGGPGWALVGDSGVHQDPWSGTGMDCAAVAAELLVDTYCASGSAARWAEAGAETYESRRDEALLPVYRETVRGAADLAAVS